jgi:hypothetical protein
MSAEDLKIESLDETFKHCTLQAHYLRHCHVSRSHVEIYIAQYRPVGCRLWRTIAEHEDASLAMDDMIQSYATTQHRWHRVLERLNYPFDPTVLCQLEHRPH